MFISFLTARSWRKYEKDLTGKLMKEIKLFVWHINEQT